MAGTPNCGSLDIEVEISNENLSIFKIQNTPAREPEAAHVGNKRV